MSLYGLNFEERSEQQVRLQSFRLHAVASDHNHDCQLGCATLQTDDLSAPHQLHRVPRQ
ncbi:hypothetical protein BDR04DRAFT_1098753 [Suillus decipiens]|nr:hypothetical protein BDR04DRAFT_1098753 [Suillus decipiens]